MAASKKEKKIKVAASLKDSNIRQVNDPTIYYKKHPSWSFLTCDSEAWPFNASNVGDSFWSEIMPRLISWESMTWNDILLVNKKSNHSIDPSSLSKAAQDRLVEKKCEAGSIVSLRLSGAHRLYGYITDGIFYVLWYDSDHGDNPTCVCRSHKKHT